MNSYPIELLAQLAPVMFVAGLDPSLPPPSGSTPTSASPEKPRASDPFNVLITRLREALVQQRKLEIFQPQLRTFQTIFVDKDIRFPPRKSLAPDDPQYSTSHSPLSPLSPQSPLHPDGLIAPIWIRKHTTLVPSVFVLFTRLFENPPHQPRSPLDVPDLEHERDREQEERRRDTELSREIAARKRLTNERSIKLTVVLIASRKMLDDSSLDARLSFIRKSGGLDSPAALFVLSPVNPSELSEFVQSLQSALYEPAVEYYTNHSKRVRRKRNRHTQTVSSYPNPITPLGGPATNRPLRPEGWTVRYEYKMACFAEFRGEDEVALKHFQDSYEMLVIMFGSTAMLPPRTKRWAEAKVLADCINIKIVKLYLYNNEHSLALSHHSTHIRKFGDFSRGWGIGEETFEFWSWIARQHRILAELLEQGNRSTLKIPTYTPVLSLASAASTANSQVTRMEVDAMRLVGINPSHALQHPGFYYYMAARCTEMRRDRFLASLQAEEQTPGSAASSPGFNNEKKVEHLVIILELYTKSYELFKAQHADSSSNGGRQTLWIAYRIAQTYYQSGKLDMAMKFFERIAKTYRREQWGSLLRPMLLTWYKCAQELGDVELSIRLLLERMTCAEPQNGENEDDDLQGDLLAVLRSTIPSNLEEPLVVDMVESQTIFDSSALFWSQEIHVGAEAGYQISLAPVKGISISKIPFESLEIHFSDEEAYPPVVLRHTAGEVGMTGGYASSSEKSISRHSQGIRLADVAHATANLRWTQDHTLVVAGRLTLDGPATIKITQLRLNIAEGSWNIQIPFSPSPTSRWFTGTRFIQLGAETDFSSVTAIRKPHKLHVSLSQQEPAYIDEAYPIYVMITNGDERSLNITMDVLLQPIDGEGVNLISVPQHEPSASLLRSISFGTVASGVSASKTITLSSTGVPADRILDISIQTRTPGVSEGEEEHVCERLETLVVPTVAPFIVQSDVHYRGRETAPVDDMDWEDSVEATVNTTVTCTGPWTIEIEKMVLLTKESLQARVVDCSIEDQEPCEYLEDDQLAEMCRIQLDASASEHVPAPAEYQITWQRILRDRSRGPTSVTIIPIPALLAPESTNVVATVSLSSKLSLHQPSTVYLQIRNPASGRTANLLVSLEQDENFVAAGLKAGRAGILPPGETMDISWKVVPMECGWLEPPKVKVTNVRDEEAGKEIPVRVDVPKILVMP